MRYASEDISKYRKNFNSFANGELDERGQKVHTDTTPTNRQFDETYANIRALIPKFLVSEKLGKLDSEERQKFEQLFLNFAEGNSVEEKILSLIQKLNTVQTANTDIANLTKNLIMLETINNLFSSFNASTIGFMMEALCAAIFGGMQISLNLSPIGESIPKGSGDEIVDFVIGKEAWSLKVLKDMTTTGMDGSIALLIKALYGSAYLGNKIKYLVILKNGKALQPEFLTFYEFEINRNNLADFLEITDKPSFYKQCALYEKTKNFKLLNDYLHSIGKVDFSGSTLKVKKRIGERFREIGVLNLSKGGVYESYSECINTIEKNILPIYDSLNNFNASLYSYFSSKQTERQAKSVQTIRASEQIPKAAKTGINSTFK